MYSDTLARFHSRYSVDENGCWVWHGGDTLGFNTRGQPQLSVKGRTPHNTLAYVASYEHFNSEPYSYAAVRFGNGLWATTGPKAPKYYDWSEIREFLSSGVNLEEVYYASEWTTIDELVE